MSGGRSLSRSDDEVLGAIDSRSVHVRVYDEIRAGLAKGLFSEGQTLTTRGLAATFGTSEMPVREAIRRLVAEKYIVQLSNRGFQVPRLDPEIFDDIIAVRLVLEGNAAALAATRASAADIVGLREINAEMETAVAEGRTKDVLRLNEEFHFAVYGISGSGTLVDIVETLWSRSGPYLSSIIQLEDGADVFSEAIAYHERIIRGIEKGNSVEASEALAEDISFAVRWYRERRSGQGEGA